MKSDKIIYCTYFDKGFLLKGLALHKSLIKYSPDAKLWVLAFDEYTVKILNKLKLKGVTVVPVSKFEDKELLAVKPTRQSFEYYWTCSPSWPLYIFEKDKDVDIVTYLDADLYFYSDVSPGVTELGNKSILVVEHRFPKGREGIAETAGKFNVAFNVFRRDKEGIACLKRWRAQTIEWCYAKPEGGKMGDQMYLNEWPNRYKNLVISKNLGVDAAPWNITQYQISKRKGKVFINNDELICYHFHQFQILGPNNFSRVHGFTLSKSIIENIYLPYEDEIKKQYRRVKEVDSNFEIKAPNQNTAQLTRQKLAKYLGPFYWRYLSLKRYLTELLGTKKS